MLAKEKKKQSVRGIYGKTLVELGKENENIVVLDADLSCSTQTQYFAKEFPQRFFDMGIAEQNLITTAVGLSKAGKIPFLSAFAMFTTGRAWEQIRNSVCYAESNVKIVATHGGITVGEDGATHQALEDVAIMRAIPKMKIIVPADAIEAKQVIKYVAKENGAFYVRLPRTDVEDVFDENKYKFNFKKAVKIKDGEDVSIFTNGETLSELLNCVNMLEQKDIDAEIIHIPVVKPLDNETIINSAKKTKRIIVIENHSVIGGLCGAICEVLSQKEPTKVDLIGFNDEFGQSGEQRALMEFYGLTSQELARRIIGLLK